MARFDVYEIRQRSARYVVDVQSDFLSHLATRVVVPLFPARELAGPVAGLNPVIAIEGKELTLFTQLLATLPQTDLKSPIASLAAYRDEITRALDLLFTGF
jgi:toxin CcdB